MDDTSTLKTTLEAIDAVIAKQRAAIKRGEDLKALMKDPRFKSVILDGYFETEAKRLFKILTDPTEVSAYTAEEIQSQLSAISTFKGYVGTKGTIEIEAAMAPSLIMKEEQYRNEVTSEFDRSGE